MNNEILTFDQTATILGIDRATLSRLRQDGKIAGDGGGVRRSNVIAYVDTLNSVPGAFVAAEVEAITGKPFPIAGSESSESAIHALAIGLLIRAIRDEAVDLHIRPQQKGTGIHLRYDGQLETVRTIPRTLTGPLMTEYKLLSGIPVTSARVPYDGLMDFSHENRLYRLRVASIPSFHGEGMALRMSEPDQPLLHVGELGLLDEDLLRLHGLTEAPGMVIFAGSAGAGKTTTIYALLLELAANGKSVVTIEDPIEAKLPGVTQTEINEKAGLTLATALRGVRRADAEIVHISDVRRWPGPLQLAVDAVADGHLVMAPLRVSPPAAVIRRIADMGIDRTQTASVLRGIVAQSLVRKLCPDCVEPLSQRDVEAHGPIHLLAAAGGYDMPYDAVLFRGRGCESCHGRGYKGRTGIFGIMEVTPTLADAIRRGADASDLNTIALANGMTTLWADGMRKSVAGITSVDEVERMVLHSTVPSR
ncbi:MAG: ATPase, T2SS/T4P/T4SS family [Capsulimonadaceae bacterium]